MIRFDDGVDLILLAWKDRITTVVEELLVMVEDGAVKELRILHVFQANHTLVRLFIVGIQRLDIICRW